MTSTYTLIVGDTSITGDERMHFVRIESIRTYSALDAALKAGEDALMAGSDSWCIPENYTGDLTFNMQKEA